MIECLLDLMAHLARQFVQLHLLPIVDFPRPVPLQLLSHTPHSPYVSVLVWLITVPAQH